MCANMYTVCTAEIRRMNTQPPAPLCLPAILGGIDRLRTGLFGLLGKEGFKQLPEVLVFRVVDFAWCRVEVEG